MALVWWRCRTRGVDLTAFGQRVAFESVFGEWFAANRAATVGSLVEPLQRPLDGVQVSFDRCEIGERLLGRVV